MGMIANVCANCGRRPLGWISWNEGDPAAPNVVHNGFGGEEND